MTTSYIERTVERYDEDTDTYIYDDIVCTVLVHPAEPDVGIMRPYAEIDMVECDGVPYPDSLSDYDREVVECEALLEYVDTMSVPRHKRHLLGEI